MRVFFEKDYLQNLYEYGESGDKAGLSSVRVNDKYRIEFEEHVEGSETIATIVNITELSNHYQ